MHQYSDQEHQQVVQEILELLKKINKQREE